MGARLPASFGQPGQVSGVSACVREIGIIQQWSAQAFGGHPCELVVYVVSQPYRADHLCSFPAEPVQLAGKLVDQAVF